MHVNASGVNLHMEISKEDSSKHTVVCEGAQTLLGTFYVYFIQNISKSR